MRSFCAVAVAVTLISSSALAASNDVGALAAGKPAGVKNAQNDASAGMAVISGIAAIAVAALAFGSHNGTAPGSVTSAATTTQ